jgi:signal transduction histidine kinase
MFSLYRKIEETEKSRDLQIDEAKASLKQSSKMVFVGEMAAGIAHQINNPLTIINGRVLKLIKVSKNPDGQSEYPHPSFRSHCTQKAVPFSILTGWFELTWSDL